MRLHRTRFHVRPLLDAPRTRGASIRECAAAVRSAGGTLVRRMMLPLVLGCTAPLAGVASGAVIDSHSTRIPGSSAAPMAVAAGPVDSTGIYAWPMSVQQGDTLGIYVSCNRSSFDLSIQREGETSVEVARYAHLAGGRQPLPDSAWANGCDWSPSLRIRIPDDWRSGVYTARYLGPDTLFMAMFIMRERNPGSTSRILFMMPVTTWQAYNPWGGHSLYPHDSVARSYVVSMKRPNQLNEGRSFYPLAESLAVAFLESRRYTIEYCINTDLQFLPDLEGHYDLVIDADHDEYWSYEMRGTMESRIARGGNVAFFTGNTCWWQIRMQGTDRIVCYKDKNLDPLTGIDDSRVTVNWYDVPVNRPENSMTGMSFRNGGYANFQGWYTDSSGYGGYWACHADHWVFAGTGLRDSSYFGASPAIVGYETDGALFQWVDGEPEATGTDGTPLNFVPLGIAPASQGHATMGIFSGPGLVFNAGTTAWAVGLPTDTTVQHITLNVIDGLLARSAGGPAGSGGDTSAGVTVSVSPNPSRTSVTIAWRATPGSHAPAVSIWDLEGRVVNRPETSATSGGGNARWDGKARGGGRVAPGVYFARVELGSMIATRRFLLLP